MSVVTKAEPLYGVEVSSRKAQDVVALSTFLPYVDAVAFNDDAALDDAKSELTSRGEG